MVCGTFIRSGAANCCKVCEAARMSFPTQLDACSSVPFHGLFAGVICENIPTCKIVGQTLQQFFREIALQGVVPTL
jgi:hypothetical protein